METVFLFFIDFLQMEINTDNTLERYVLFPAYAGVFMINIKWVMKYVLFIIFHSSLQGKKTLTMCILHSLKGK